MANSYRFDGDIIFLMFPFNLELKDKVKDITGAYWNPATKEWGIPIKNYNEKAVFDIVLDYGFKESTPEKKISKVELEPIDYSHLEDKFKQLSLKFNPRPYQKENVAYGLDKRRIINGDDMGLGKTFAAMLTVEIDNAFPCLVITPASTKYQFAEAWVDLCGRKSVSIIESKETKTRKNNWNADVVFINYDILGKLVDNGRKGKKGNVLKDLELRFPELIKTGWKSLILDEAHFVKNTKAARSAAVKKIIKDIDMRLFLTGTAVDGKPSEAINLFKLLGKFEDIAYSWTDYIYRYCNARTTPFGIDYSGASNILELNQKMRQTCYIRHEKRDVLDDLPPVVKTVIDVTLSNQKEYSKALNNVYDYFFDKGGIDAVDKLSGAEHLVLMNELRQLSINGKMKQIEQYLKDWADGSDEKLIVFGEHRDPIIKLAAKFKCKKIIGGISSEKKREIVKGFKDSDDQFLFCNIQAAGTGTDGLQDASSNMLIIELPWTASALDQTISRLDRSGQKFSTNIVFLLAMNNIDGDMWTILESKEEVSSGVNKGIDIDNDLHGLKKVLKNMIKDLQVKK